MHDPKEIDKTVTDIVFSLILSWCNVQLGSMHIFESRMYINTTRREWNFITILIDTADMQCIIATKQMFCLNRATVRSMCCVIENAHPNKQLAVIYYLSNQKQAHLLNLVSMINVNKNYLHVCCTFIYQYAVCRIQLTSMNWIKRLTSIVANTISP